MDIGVALTEERIESLRYLMRRKRFTPEELVIAAKPKSHPWHDFIYDKSPTEAAHEYYLDRARTVYQMKIVLTDHGSPVPRKLPIATRDPDAEHNEQSYVSTERVIREARANTDRETAQKILASEMKRVIELLERSLSYAEAIGNHEGAIREMKESAVGIRESILKYLGVKKLKV